MQQNFKDEETSAYIKKNVTFCVGKYALLQQMETTPAMQPFSDTVVDFLEAFSKTLLHGKDSHGYADIVTLGFWCRRASVLAMKKSLNTEKIRIGRGIAFHIAPSNVAVNFAYSMITGLLAGNSNIVRLPSKQFPQVDMIVAALQQVLQEFPHMAPYVILVKYERDKQINDVLSALCDIRVIWGGDVTIETLRTSPLRPRAKEICFADRYSICVIDADRYLADQNYDAVARGFYNDTYLNDQNACTSPKLLVWLGEQVAEAQKVFWQHLQEIVQSKYEISAVQVIDKLDAALQYAATCDDGVQPRYQSYDGQNKINRVQLRALRSDLLTVKQNSGLFFEFQASGLKDILPICGTKLQTVAFVGVDMEVFHTFLRQYCPRGIDRIVPVGRTLDFSLIWDGYDLVGEMTRQIGG